MATAYSLPILLSSLTDSLTSSLSSLPSPSTIHSPPSSFSLLSTKNELFLAYLQNLTLLIILTLRAHPVHTEIPNSSPNSSPKPITEEISNGQKPINPSIPNGKGNKPNRHTIYNEDGESASKLRDAVVGNLIELRVYLEKGVRPLEGRLKYQLDKLLLAAADHARESKNHASIVVDDDEHHDEHDPKAPASYIAPLAHRPNPTALMRPSSTNHVHPTATTTTATTAPYRPPRVNPTAPPTDSASKRAPRRSRAVDAFIREEMGDAPLPEMSIGAGRGGAAEDGRQAEKERERQEWEETRLARLPGEKKRRRGAGEEFTAGMHWGLMDGERAGGDERERKRKKKGGKSKNVGGRGSTGKRKGRK